MRCRFAATASCLVCTASLVACGVETAGTAATSAAIKKNEVEQGVAAKERANEQLQQSLQLMQQRQQQTEDAGR